MTKLVNKITTTETIETIETTLTVEKDDESVVYMELDTNGDTSLAEFFKANNIPVRTMFRFGADRTYAIIPADKLDLQPGEDPEAKVALWNKNFDSHRRNSERKNNKVRKHEGASYDQLCEAGFDPSTTSLDIAIKVSNKFVEKTDAHSEDADDTKITSSEEKLNAPSEYSDSYSDKDEDDSHIGKRIVSKGAYNSSTDTSNPEYITAKNILYSKLYAMIDELDGEDLEIVTAIMNGESERDLAKRLDVPRSTIQSHREKLMSHMRKNLGDDWR